MIIALMLILDTMTHWDSPYSFFTNVFAVKDEQGNLQRQITGTIGTFLGMWWVQLSD
ncbi:MAG: hypothetical protein Q9227_004443 [Pyrenula ochraceoflavens]